jgi:hypothetical protein
MSVMAVVSKAQFETQAKRDGRLLAVGDVWPTTSYRSENPNLRSLASAVFQKEVERRWLFALPRRSQRRRLTWERMQRLSDRWIHSPKILHHWPEERFDAKTRGRSRVR